MTKRIPHWIDGARVDLPDRRLSAVFDPATGAQSGSVTLAETADVAVAVRAAALAFPAGTRRRADVVLPHCSRGR
ncbi:MULTISPECIES: hypothetical protein [Microbacterium]|uniref:hypothetical protein n=1 Tax=Microbacterium TaxID=33882 RepID=UPI0012FD73F0|nr:hypothetical protein [Microbacterium lacus]